MGDVSAGAAASSTLGSASSDLSDAIEALSAIGYTRSEIMTALRGVDTSNMSLEEIFKTATKKLMK